MRTELLRECLDYILSFERDDYDNWCFDNDKNKEDYQNNNHIYAKAYLAETDLGKIEETL